MGGLSKTEFAFVEAFNEISKRVHLNSKEKGFWDEDEDLIYRAVNLDTAKHIKSCIIAKKIALIHSEISEALEGDRGQLLDDKLPHRLMLEVELADAGIRIMDLGHWLGLDVASAIIEKHKFNTTREHKHGKGY